MMRKNRILKSYIIVLLILIGSLSFSQEKDSLTINYNLINSIPQDAGIYFNGNYMGNTPYRFMFSPADSANGIAVVLKMKGYVDFSFKVNKEDQPLNKTINLISAGKNSTVKDKKLVIENKSSLFKSPRKLVPIALSSLVAGSGAILGFVFKSKANDLYDEYVNTGNRSKLDDTKKYDLYSGLSLAAFQVGFTALIYFLLIK